MVESITARELKNKLEENRDFYRVNVLSRKQYDRAHIPESINIPLGEDFEERTKKQLLDKNQKIIVYCASFECDASPTAAKKLEEMGYNNVIDFDDGIKRWKEKNYPVESKQ